MLSGRAGTPFLGTANPGKGGLTGLLEQSAKEAGAAGIPGATPAVTQPWGAEDLLVPAEKCRESFQLALAGLGPELGPTQRTLRCVLNSRSQTRLGAQAAEPQAFWCWCRAPCLLFFMADASGGTLKGG